MAKQVVKTGGDTAPLREGERRTRRRNFLMHCVEGGFFGGAVAFVAPDTLVPPLLREMGSPGWLIAISPQLMLLGFMTTPLFFAHRAEGRDRILPRVMFWGLFQRLPYLLASLVLFAAAVSPFFPDWAAMSVIVGAPYVSGLMGGVAISAWSALVAKTVAPKRRASLAAIRNTLAALLGILAGLLTERLLEIAPGVRGYAWLHLIAFALFMVSFAAFSRLREARAEVRPQGNPSVWSNLRSLPVILRQDRRLCYFLGSLSCGHGILIILPFLSIHALNVLEQPTAFAGALLAAKSAGVFSGNLLGAILGDRLGGKSVFLAAYSCFFLTAVLSLFVTSVAGFLLVFFLFGMGFTMRVVGQQTLTLEIAPLERLPTYFALALSGTAPFMLLAAGIAVVAGGYAERIDAFWPLAVPSALATLAAMLLMLRVKEPRNDQPADSERTPVALE